MKELMREAVQLFEEVMFQGAEHVIDAMEGDVWREYSREQLQLLKLLEQFGPIQAGQLAQKQGVHKSAVSNRLKKTRRQKPCRQPTRSRPARAVD